MVSGGGGVVVSGGGGVEKMVSGGQAEPSPQNPTSACKVYVLLEPVAGLNSIQIAGSVMIVKGSQFICKSLTCVHI